MEMLEFCSMEDKGEIKILQSRSIISAFCSFQSPKPASAKFVQLDPLIIANISTPISSLLFYFLPPIPRPIGSEFNSHPPVIALFDDSIQCREP